MFEPGGQSSAEGSPLAKTQKKVKKWWWISGCRGCPSGP